MFKADTLEVEEARNDTGDPTAILANGFAFRLNDYPELIGRIAVHLGEYGQEVKGSGFVSERDGVVKCCIVDADGYALYDWSRDDYHEARLTGKVRILIDGVPAVDYMGDHYSLPKPYTYTDGGKEFWPQGQCRVNFEAKDPRFCHPQDYVCAVFLNGDPQIHVKCANSAEGWVVRYKCNENGEIEFSGKLAKLEKVEGDVEIMLDGAGRIVQHMKERGYVR